MSKIFGEEETAGRFTMIQVFQEYQLFRSKSLKIFIRQTPFQFVFGRVGTDEIKVEQNYTYSMDNSLPFPSNELVRISPEKLKTVQGRLRDLTRNHLNNFFHENVVKGMVQKITHSPGLYHFAESKSFCENMLEAINGVFRNNFSFELYAQMIKLVAENFELTAHAVAKSIRNQLLNTKKYKLDKHLVITIKYYQSNIQEISNFFLCFFLQALDLRTFFRSPDVNSNNFMKKQAEIFSRVDKKIATDVLKGNQLDIEVTIHLFVDALKDSVLLKLIPIQNELSGFIKKLELI